MEFTHYRLCANQICILEVSTNCFITMATKYTMEERVHYIPVGFDFERLIQPISQGSFATPHRVILLHTSRRGDENQAAKLASTMVSKLSEDFDRILGIETEVESLEDIYDYGAVYEYAHTRFKNELHDGNKVFVNISSMPRTVAFAFATAAESLIIEEPERRGNIQTYYVSPERYLILDILEELQEEVTFLQENFDQAEGEVEDRIDRLEKLVDDVLERGITRGARQMNGGRHVNIPAPPMASLSDFHKKILWYLYEEESVGSTSKLAEKLASEHGTEYDESYRSRVQYNIQKLENIGYIRREDEGKGLTTTLSKMGTLWARTHS
jgi:hypothetical protein